MQYYVIDCEFVGTDIPDFIINESYTLTGFFFYQIRCFYLIFCKLLQNRKNSFLLQRSI